MGSDLFVAAPGAVARLRDLEVVGNNLANAHTIAFKADRPLFRTVLESRIGDAYRRSTPGAPGRAFVSVRGLSPDLAPGPTSQTGAPLDVAIRGPGFFEVETDEGLRYTRAGSFSVDPQGRLTTMDGHPVIGSTGFLRIGSASARIVESGDVVDRNDRPLGKLKVVDFERPEELQKLGANLFRAPIDALPEPVIDPVLRPGMLEQANVTPMHELARLVVLQRAFEANMQALSSRDQATQRLLQEVRS